MKNNFFNVSDLSIEDLKNIIYSPTNNNKNLSGKNIGLLFEKQSTRTRLSFAVGINHLGGNVIDIRLDDLNIKRDETFEDTFKAFNCYLDGLIYRTTNHQRLIDASNYFEKPIINALSDFSHPCQAISDLYTLNEHFNITNINILWMGDMNNVCYSLLEAVNLLKSFNLYICSHENIINQNDWKFGDNVIVTNNINEINLSNIHCIMTDVFISMNDQNDNSKIDYLKQYSVTNDLFNSIKRDGVFMHCLPAKIGLEVCEEVFKSPRSIVWKQAHNRMVAQKKLLNIMNW